MIFGPIASVIASIQQGKAAKKINPQDVDYTESPYAKEMMNLARLRMNSQMPGMAEYNRKLGQDAAGVNASVARGASSGNQVLQGAFAAAEQAQQGRNNALMMGANFDQQNLANLGAAQRVMIGEGDKKFMDENADFERDFAAKAALKNAQWQNMVGAFNSLDEGIASIAGTALGAGMPISSLWKKK